jgi:uncharacterized protein (DUF1800 family)
MSRRGRTSTPVVLRALCKAVFKPIISRTLCLHRNNGQSIVQEDGMAFTTYSRSLKTALAALALSIAAATPALARDCTGSQCPMDETRARAMLFRFGYGPTPTSLAATVGQTPAQFIKRAISGPSTVPSAVGKAIAELATEPVEVMWEKYGLEGNLTHLLSNLDTRKEVRRLIKQTEKEQIQQRFLSMANNENQGFESLLSFWLNHFSIFALKGNNQLLLNSYSSQIAAGMKEDSFEALLRASFYHPSMQIYLDNRLSVSPGSPAAKNAARNGKQPGINENLARELLELHTLGVNGGYTQKDVQMLARIITGAGVHTAKQQRQERQLAEAGATRYGLFVFDPRRHDFGEKLFLKTTFPSGQGLGEIDRALRLMAQHPSTASHIAGKLARRYLDDQPPPALVAAMAAGYSRSGGRISATLLPLLNSDEFAASLARPRKLKEPLDYILSLARMVCGEKPILNARPLATAATSLGQMPFMRTTPDGYGAQEPDWLSSIAMAKRIGVALTVVEGRPNLGGTDDPATRCDADAGHIARMLGTLSEKTRNARRDLTPNEEAAFLLASPESMRR